MPAKAKAMGVHLLTASGAVFAMLAMLAAAKLQWDVMFLWLVVALIVDGIDGPLARRFDTKTNAPEYDGALMDLIIDYLNYVFVPAYALFVSGRLEGWTGWFSIIIITFVSAMYFADTRMKTKDNSFSGFPACWNMVILVIFALEPNFWLAFALIAVLTVTMVFPIKFIHPVRTERWRMVSLPVSIAWIALATVAAWKNFDHAEWVSWGLIATSAYLLFAGIAQQVMPQRS